MTILLFFLVLFVLILVHEWGHFIAAKKTDMRVDEFGIGFPPKLFSVKKGETEYSLNLLPIGGFVRIFGENATDAADSGEYKRSFVAKSKGAQAIVLLAGVTMNIIFAWFLLVAVFMLGVPTAVDETAATDRAELVVTGVLPNSPAESAGLVTGAEIVSVVSGEIELQSYTPSEFSNFVRTANAPVTVVTKSSGETLESIIQPESGLIPAEPEAQAVGISLALVETVSVSFPQAIYKATLTTGNSLVAITVGLFTLLVQSVQGTADFSQVAGPVGIVGLVGDAAQFGLASLLMFTAVISLNLAIINLLPFPALDGGRLLFVAIEVVTQKTIQPIWVYRLNAFGLLLLLLLMVAVTYNDILRIL